MNLTKGRGGRTRSPQLVHYGFLVQFPSFLAIVTPWLTKLLSPVDQILVLIRDPSYCDLGLTYPIKDISKTSLSGYWATRDMEGQEEQVVREDNRGGEYAQSVICLYENVTEKAMRIVQMTHTN